MVRCLVLLVVVLIPAFASAQTLEEKLKPIIASHKGKIAIAVKHLGTGETYYHQADEVMPTASLIKLPIMVETFRLVDAGKHKFDQKLTLTKEDQVPGAGVLTDSFSPGATFTLLDAVRLMITVSDNTATNMVLDTITIPATNETMVKLGFPNTKINAKVYKGSVTSVDPERTKKYGLGSTTAKEMVGLLELIGTKKVVNEKACDEMLGILKKNQDSELIVRNLPPGAVFAHKTGAVTAARTDAGLLYVAGKPMIAICILTNENEDKRWVIDNEAQLVLSKLGRAIHDHFVPMKK
ncbi:MAG: serine hydrolase [Fimbriiglobus sp.]